MNAAASLLSRSELTSSSEVERWQAALKAFANSIKLSTKPICFSDMIIEQKLLL